MDAPSPDGGGRPVAAGARLRASVLCLVDAARPDEVVGTGFAIAPGWVLTCAHVAVQLRGRTIRVDDRDGLVLDAGAAELAPDPSAFDLALLAVDAPLGRILPVFDGPVLGGAVTARGYAPVPGAGGPGGRELRFSRRGAVRAEYGAHAIADAFELAEDMAEGGFSGSPLMDVASGAVVGVVSGGDASRGRSWAVPLRGAAAGWPALEGALAWNDAHVPRWGRAVNAAGGRVACALAAAAALRRFQDRGKFDPALHVDRAALPPPVRAFRAAERPAMAAVGGSNTGKTWLLCDLARTAEMAPCLLLAAGDLSGDAPLSPEAFASAAIRAGWPEGPDLPDAPGAGAVAAALADGERLLVLLDAVNEAIDVRGFARDWLPEAAAWTKRCGARLLLTSRPEPWPGLARMLPADGLHDPEGRVDAPVEARLMRLGDFTVDEAALALERYRLDRGLALALGRHPLMFRLAAHRPGAAAGLGLYRMIDAFVAWHVDEAARTLGLRSTATLRERLRGVADVLMDQESLALPLAQVREAMGGDAALDAMLGCGLLIGAGTQGEAIRFAFDQVAEATAPAPDPASLFVISAGPIDLRRHYAGLLRTEADGNEADFASGFSGLLNLLGLAAREGQTPAPLASDGPVGLLEGLYQIGKAIGFAALRGSVLAVGEMACAIARALPQGRHLEIGQIYHALTQFARAMALHSMFGELLRWFQEAPVPEPVRTKLTLDVAAWAGSYPYRRKDWTDPACAYALSEDGRDEIGGVLAMALRRDLAGVLPVLVSALADETRIEKGLSGDSRGEASLASLAGAVLFHGPRDALASIVAAVLAQPADMAGWLIGAIAGRDGMALLDLVIPALDDPVRRMRAVWAIRDAAAAATPGQLAGAVAALEAMLTPDAQGLEAAVTLRTLDPANLAAWDRVAAAVEGGVAAGSHLAPVPAGRFGRALALARARAPQGALWMADHAGPVAEQAVMVEALAGPGRPGVPPFRHRLGD